MNTLSENWFAEGVVDFEYKKYVLLGYLKKVYQEFERTAIYPSLSDVIFHYRNLKNYLENKELLSEGFPKQVSKADINRLKLIYKKVINDDGVVEELNQISEFAIGKLKETLSTGTEIYDFAESKFSIEPIGIIPMYVDEGYMMTMAPPGKELSVYAYKSTLFEGEHENYRGLALNYIETKPYSISTTFENIKLELVNRFRQLPNPATYMISSSMKFPYESTFLPIAKRLLMRDLCV